jgi:hypothetical protein
MMLLLAESRTMPQLLWVAVLSEMVLPLEATQIPALPDSELRATNPSRMQPSALRMMALAKPPASTTGEPTPCSVSCLFTLTFSWYLPLWTSMVSPAEAASMAAWMVA